VDKLNNFISVHVMCQVSFRLFPKTGARPMTESYSISALQSKPLGRYPAQAPGAFTKPTILHNTLTSYAERNSLHLPFYAVCIIIVMREISKEI
jgi:hypothetical protein